VWVGADNSEKQVQLYDVKKKPAQSPWEPGGEWRRQGTRKGVGRRGGQLRENRGEQLEKTQLNLRTDLYNTGVQAGKSRKVDKNGAQSSDVR